MWTLMVKNLARSLSSYFQVAPYPAFPIFTEKLLGDESYSVGMWVGEWMEDFVDLVLIWFRSPSNCT
ncbi:hypothetical protein [Egbenema bharatensis]|uniref:hypothetical protein n=1 Tax=Egbenema bharatensis TaxID=3463334 RepID=UPI003A8A0C33